MRMQFRRQRRVPPMVSLQEPLEAGQDGGLPDKDWHYSIGLLAEFFCAAAVAQGVYVSFFCAAAVWMLAEMCRLRGAEE